MSLIEEYSCEMGQLESLPELKSIELLIEKSDRSLYGYAICTFGLPISIISNPEHVADFYDEPMKLYNECLLAAMSSDYATSALFWLFIQREPTLYHGPYVKLFEKSLLYNFMNIVTME